MKNTLFVLSAAALLTASAATAGTLQGEVRFGDVTNSARTGSTEYKADYSAALNPTFNYGIEMSTKQKEDQGSVDSKLAARIGVAGPTLLGAKTQTYVEAGTAIKQNADATFWGVGVKASHKLFGPVTGSIGYRHRESFAQNDSIKEDRINAGVSVDIGNGNAVGAQYYRTTGTSESAVVGLQISHKF
jgi:hypothetical protein